ncbi:hypothetical protein MYX76_15355 [Desulfobacterota bacterium AH_259_B03_O07]|nr:hypothetical protein [Desulfobacterota bacterium AH_259_B03_O07]
MNHIALKFFILLVLFSTIAKAQELETPNSMILHPEWYIKVTDWSYYAASRVAMISHVRIENTADISYKNIKIKLNFYSTSYGNAGEQVSSTIGVLPITIPPHSKKTYLRGGMPIGMGEMSYKTKYVQVLGAVPIVNDSLKKFIKTKKPKLTL